MSDIPDYSPVNALRPEYRIEIRQYHILSEIQDRHLVMPKCIGETGYLCGKGNYCPASMREEDYAYGHIPPCVSF